MSTRLQIMPLCDIIAWIPDFPEDLHEYATVSNPIFIGIYHDQPFCVIGLVPQRIVGTVGIWGWNTPLVADHPFVYARWAHRLLSRVAQLYPRIVGACSSDKMAWLASLGATFPLAPTDDLIPFEIKAPQ